MSEHIANNLVTLVSANSLNGLKSGNVIIDVIMSLLFVMMIPILIEKVRKFDLLNVFSFKRNEPFTIKLCGTSKYGKNGSCYRDYSNKFCALCKYMEDECDLDNMTEIFFSRWESTTGYLPGTSDNIKLTSSIMCNIEYTTIDDSRSFAIEIVLRSSVSLDDVKNFLNDILIKYEERMSEELHQKQRYFCPEMEEDRVVWNRFTFESSKTMDNIFFPSKAEVMDKIDAFVNGRERYWEMGAPWTLGILLHGEPGTGKTSFIKALANYTNRHIIELPLNQIGTHKALREVMFGEQISKLTVPFEKRIYLMEDVDCLDDIVASREEPSNKGKEKESDEGFSWLKDIKKSKRDELTLSNLLNAIQGPLEAPGRILVMTTNHPDKLDKALIRDRRIDINIKMTPLQGKSLQEMILSFFPDKNYCDLAKYTPLTNTNNITPATIQNLCFTSSFDKVCEMLQ